MLKNEYTLSQKGIFSPSGNFTIIQHLQQLSQAQSLSHINNNNSKKQHSPTMTCGQFSQKKSCCFLFNCLSCRTINNLTLTLYQQIVSKSFIQSCINLLPCIISQQLIVTTVNDILIGKIKKQTCCNENILIIYDNEQKEFQFSSLMPRMLRCGKNVNYKICQYQGKNKQKQTGEIIHRIERECLTKLFTYLNTYQVIFPKNSNDKDKILLFNAIVYLDIAKHLIF